MKERPILFSGPMVRAILEGRKTQTRREVKFNHKPWLEPLPHIEYARDGNPIWLSAEPSKEIRDSDYFDKGYPCPYGKPGDRLWVRETWGESSLGKAIYRASTEEVERIAAEERWVSSPRWRPSIHMPRWASRITLELTDVRVERLQEISDRDAEAEGVGGMRDMRFAAALGNITSPAYRLNFIDLWESINGKGSWNLNPWVWVLEFRRLEA